MPAHSLKDLLENYQPARPRIVWYGGTERIELSGHVLSMWQAKTAGLITAETAPGTPVHLGAPVHWRTVAWACGAWLAGRPVILGPGEQAQYLAGAAGCAPTELSMAFSEAELDPEAPVQVLMPAQSLATRWHGSLPALVIDGAAELMSYADTFSALASIDTQLGLIQPAKGNPGSPPTPCHKLTRAQLAQSQLATPTPPGSGAALVRAHDVGEALTQVLGAWRQGLTAVVLAPDADADLTAAAARQEGAAL